ncbi:hypothetical protein GCM10027168_26360 [Streptomyces capparidis]
MDHRRGFRTGEMESLATFMPIRAHSRAGGRAAAGGWGSAKRSAKPSRGKSRAASPVEKARGGGVAGADGVDDHRRWLGR